MKNYTITVNGNVYDVTVEENGTSAATAPAAPKKQQLHLQRQQQNQQQMPEQEALRSRLEQQERYLN